MILPMLGMISRWFLIIWILLVAAEFLSKFNSRTRLQHLGFLCYIAPFELLARVLQCTPFIPYELSKYLFVIYSIALIIRFNRDFKPAILIFSSVILSIVIYGFDKQNYTFNALGPISLILLSIAFKDTIITDPFVILRLIILPLISLWFYCLINTPNISELDYSFSSSDLLTGGFGTNQVATAFGVACLILYLFIFFRIRFTSFLLGDVLLFSFLLIQGLLSFSRGGVLGFFGAGIVFSIIYLFRSGRFRTLGYLGLGLVLVAIGFLYVNKLTGNQLLSRYKGETYGVKVGGKENDLNNLTTNRFEIFMSDIDLWRSEILFGIGIGNSRFARAFDNGNVAHTELSRLLAEQGIFGLLFFIQWLWLGGYGYMKNRTTYGKALVAAFFFLALFSSFHAAIRTFVSPLFTALSVVTFLPISRFKMQPLNSNNKNHVRNNRIVSGPSV